MARDFHTTLQVGASPSEILDLITDLDSWSDWLPGLVQVEKLTDGDFGVGTRWRETRRMFGKEASEVFEVIEYEPPRRLSLHVDGAEGSSKRGAYQFVYEFVPGESGTRIEFDGTIEMPGLVFRLMGGMLTGTFKKACIKDLEALKMRLESGSGDAAVGDAHAG